MWLTAFQISIRAILKNKVRTALAVLGVVIGIATVIIVFSAGEGLRGLVFYQVNSFGTNIIETEIKLPTSKHGIAAEADIGTALVAGAQVTTLTLDDMKDVDKLPNVQRSYAAITAQEQISYGNQLRRSLLMGVSASFIDIDKGEIAEGRFFTEEEDKNLANVVVLGKKIKEKLFGESDALGKSIKIGKSKYQVIGIMTERGAVMTMDFDDFVYLPVRTTQKKVLGINHILYMVHELRDMTLADMTAGDVREILRANHDINPNSQGIYEINKDDFRVTTMQEMFAILETVTGALTLLLLVIVAISLVVGGVGIMNIMYVIVNERSAEIGLRKAVGAHYKDIRNQFLLEAIIIALIGGIVGIALGTVISFLISFGAAQIGLAWQFIIPMEGVLVALGFSFFFGILFGVYPARRAAKLDPVVTLRGE